MSIAPKFVQLTADVLNIYFYKIYFLLGWIGHSTPLGVHAISADEHKKKNVSGSIWA